VKSILTDFRKSKTAGSTISYFSLKMSIVANISKLRVSQMVKKAVFGASK